MESGEAARLWPDVPPPVQPSPRDGLLDVAAEPAAALVWAGLASTLYRIRRGEGALLAVNLSLIAAHGLGQPGWLARALVSVLVIGLMYAVNDLYDAPSDVHNPKKDRTLTATYLQYRRAGAVAIGVAKLGTLVFAWATLGPGVTAAVAATMLVNVVYSAFLKGVPVVDVVWCGLWGGLYAAIASASPTLLLVVALMTAVCHLYQALDDRDVDAANAVTTTAVRSPGLSLAVLAGLAGLLAAVLWPALGGVWAMTAFVPAGIFLAAHSPRTGWLLTKGYFGVLWLVLLGITGAGG